SHTVRRGETELNAHFFGQSSFARQAIVDERSLVRLPAETSDDELAVFAPLGCGLQTGAGAVLNVLRPTPDDVLVVAGAGAVGMAAVMAAEAVSVGTIVVIDTVASRLDLAVELGAHATINASDEDVAARLAALDVTAAIDTTGNVGVLETLIAGLAPHGTCVVIGAPKAGSRASFDVNALLPGRRIVGVTLGDSEPERFVPQLISLYRAGRFPIDRLERQFPFVQIAAAAAAAKSGDVIKPVLTMNGALS
ncbi:MAG: zinc-binding dehydrogenase, partial [Microbacterium sp.]